MFAKSKVESAQPSQFRFRLPIPAWRGKRKKPWQVPQESNQIDRDELIELFSDKLREEQRQFTPEERAEIRLNKALRDVLYN